MAARRLSGLSFLVVTTLSLTALACGGLPGINDAKDKDTTTEGDADADANADTDVDTTDPDADRDQDGYPASDDCDDGDGNVNPGETEHCNGIDDDCDGDTDEADAAEATAWYPDSDGDGYGDPDALVWACEQPAGAVADDGDCDDSDASVHPDAPEYCNGVSDDCDRDIDEDAVDADYYAPDADGDGFGATGDLELSCSGVDNDWDCDDRDSTEPQYVDDGATGAQDGTLSRPWDTVQEGIDNASRCVVVRGGTYDEAIDYNGRNLKVTGVDGSAATTIDASGTNAPAATFSGGESALAELRGFTLTGGAGFLEETSVTSSCGSTATCTDYYSVYCGGGVYADNADPSLVDLVITANSLPEAASSASGDDTYYTESYGGGVCLLASTAALEDVYVYANFADQGGGIYADTTSNITLSQAYLYENESTDGAGLMIDGGAATATNVLSAGNDASASGGGVSVIDGSATLINWTISADRALDGAGLYLYGSTVALSNSIVYSCRFGPGVELASSSSLTSGYNDVYGTTAGNYSGVTDPTGSNGNISSDPRFTSISNNSIWTDDDYSLQASSPALNTGNPSATYNDADGSRNDMGAFGGPSGAW